jgi:hypothetical protein
MRQNNAAPALVLWELKGNKISLAVSACNENNWHDAKTSLTF